MKGPIAAPDGFNVFEDIFLWDEYGEIKEEVMNAIYMKPFFSYLVLADNFFCSVYWNDNIGYWCGELWGDEGYLNTYICDSPEEIKDEILEDYGDRIEE
ncbi:hypothetical protein SAMN05518672_102356 [Chitinophaga sp. CF118]|uniref:hypothetical protein n=1 Tax=Chitinophaga sp. CF118 TaxID=1884367 RepID=UPI0008E01D9B|nr:hypothetical protein [Chitinophaga sp. CF118]SFD54117.1 hypothetical protein SAMN05518672_102356 [Chitinophaga sp. CF118]